MIFYCIYPNGFEITKHDREALKGMKKIVTNYLKIEKLYKSRKTNFKNPKS